MKKNILNTMKQFAKYICAVVVMLGMSVSAWGTNSFDVSSITIDDLDWGTSTDYLTAYVGYDNGSIVTSDNDNVFFGVSFGSELIGKTMYVTEEGHTDGFGFWDNLNNGYIAYLSSAGVYAITFQYLITEPYTSHTATIKFFYYDGSDPSADASGRVIVLSIPVTINMTGGYVISTAVDPSATGTMTAKVNGSARTRVMSNERLDLVATPADGYQFLGWTTDGDEDTDWEIDNDMSASTYAYIHANQTITANFEVACTSRSITMSDFSKDFGSADFVPTHTVSAGSGTKTWTSSNTDVATIVDGKVHIVAAGTTTIGLSVAADDPYCAVSKNCTMTVNALVPTVTAFTGTSSSPTSITLTNAQVSNKGGAAITAYGYIYSTTASTTEALKLGESGVSTATVASADIAASTNFASKTVSELTTGTTYYVRAYATNSAGTGYSAIQSVKTIAYTDYKFSCADWSLTGPSGDIVFITSAASKTVRSQEAFHVSGNGLPHETALTFTTFPVNAKFEFKKADGSAISTDEYGVVDADVYVFYTPGIGDTSDGLDEITSLTVSVTGEPRTATIDTKRIIGRHLPADFVIAAKKDGKWWAMPSNMASTTNPTPKEIGVDDDTNPSAAYVVTSSKYGLAGPTATNISDGNGQYIRFAMSIDDGTLDPHAAPLFGTTGTTLGKSGNSQITSDLSAGNWWKLVQTNTSITNPQDAKYTIYCANNTQSLTLEDGGLWGLYATNGTDVDELRLIPRDDDVWFEEARIVEWGQHSLIVEFDNSLGMYDFAKAKIGETETEGFAEVSQTETSVQGLPTKYNYTINFGDAIDFSSATPGDMLTLKWYTYGKTWYGVSNVTIPKIIATDGAMKTIESTDTPWSKWEVHVLPGVTLDANAGSFSSGDVTIDNLQIYPGATVKVTSGTLAVTNLSLRNGWTRAGAKRYDVARLQIKTTANLTHKNAYLDWYIDNDQYYPVAVPFPVTVSAITYLNTKNSVTIGGTSGVIRLRYFDGANRAAGKSGNWKFYGEDGGLAVPAQLLPSMGYAMAAKRPGGKAFSIVRMPMTFTNEWTALGEQGSATVAGVALRKDTVHVFAYGNEKTAEWNKGWNLIGNPYMAVFHGDDREEGIYGKLLAVTNIDDPKKDKVRYVTIPNSSFTDYAQVNFKDTLLKPSSSFLIQAKDTCRIEFSNSKIDKPTAPARYTATPTEAPEQEAYIRLSYEGGSDQMGLIIGEDYTAAYETNADLMKMLGEEQNTLKTYMMYNDVEMAYVAINEDLASEWIPITVRIPETGEYTYSLTRASEIDNLEGVYLIDYETNTVTNLIGNNYSFVATEGTIDDRFAINAIVGRHETPTDIDIINAGGDVKSDKPVKFIYNDKVFILHNGVIYDSTGKKVREINR